MISGYTVLCSLILKDFAGGKTRPTSETNLKRTGGITHKDSLTTSV